ncbi:hypothetical protein CLOM_g9261 [Closterium sp. NIES-68]|nr:hypothetical protein CLOM_g9261 [Closterium sp. NIES-68]
MLPSVAAAISATAPLLHLRAFVFSATITAAATATATSATTATAATSTTISTTATASTTGYYFSAAEFT